MASLRVMYEERMVPDRDITPAQAEAKASGSDMFVKKCRLVSRVRGERTYRRDFQESPVGLLLCLLLTAVLTGLTILNACRLTLTRGCLANRIIV